jgi:hypothetical protein
MYAASRRSRMENVLYFNIFPLLTLHVYSVYIHVRVTPMCVLHVVS